MTVISDWIKTELHELGNLSIGRSAGMTDSKIRKSKNKNSLRVFCKRRVDELPDITMYHLSLYNFASFSFNPSGSPLTGQTALLILKNRVAANKLIHRKLCNIIISSRS